MDRELINSILKLIESFDRPVNDLSNAIANVNSPELRGGFDKALGEVMFQLDTEIGSIVRRELEKMNS